jgi:hypothetical protein
VEVFNKIPNHKLYVHYSVKILKGDEDSTEILKNFFKM